MVILMYLSFGYSRLIRVEVKSFKFMFKTGFISLLVDLQGTSAISITILSGDAIFIVTFTEL